MQLPGKCGVQNLNLLSGIHMPVSIILTYWPPAVQQRSVTNTVSLLDDTFTV